MITGRDESPARTVHAALLDEDLTPPPALMTSPLKTRPEFETQIGSALPDPVPPLPASSESGASTASLTFHSAPSSLSGSSQLKLRMSSPSLSPELVRADEDAERKDHPGSTFTTALN